MASKKKKASGRPGWNFDTELENKSEDVNQQAESNDVQPSGFWDVKPSKMEEENEQNINAFIDQPIQQNNHDLNEDKEDFNEHKGQGKAWE